MIDSPLVNADSVRVKNKLDSLNIFRAIKAYQRQKSSLQRQPESRLWSLTEQKTLSMASPQDVISFLVWTDKFGKTVVHSDQCTSLREGDVSCSCHESLAAGTIDSNIDKLRSIFRENGRGLTWNDDLKLGNPATPRCKRILWVNFRGTDLSQENSGSSCTNVSRQIEALLYLSP